MRLVFTERWRVGSDSGVDDSFGAIRGVAMNSRGQLFVLDASVHHVAVFDSTGRRLRAIGRKGEGPGEFMTPWSMLLDRNDSLLVSDLSLFRVSVFDQEGRYVRSFRMPPTWTLSRELPNGDLLVTGYARGHAGAVHHLSRDGTLVRTFHVGVPRAVPELYGYETSLLGGAVALDDGVLVYANKSPYSLSFVDVDSGRVLHECAGRPEWTTDPRSVVRLAGRVVSLEWSNYVHVSGVHVLAPGRYLVVTNNPRREVVRLDIVDRDCRLLHRVENRRVGVARVTNGGRTAVGVSTENGSPQAVVYSLRVHDNRSE